MEKDIINGEGTTDDGNRSRPRGWRFRLAAAVLAAVGLAMHSYHVDISDTRYAAQLAVDLNRDGHFIGLD